MAACAEKNGAVSSSLTRVLIVERQRDGHFLADVLLLLQRINASTYYYSPAFAKNKTSMGGAACLPPLPRATPAISPSNVPQTSSRHRPNRRCRILVQHKFFCSTANKEALLYACTVVIARLLITPGAAKYISAA